MKKTILSKLKKHETFFWLFIFFLCIGTMFVHYQLEPTHESQLKIKNKNFTLINGETKKLEEYLPILKSPSFRNKIKENGIIDRNFSFNEKLKLETNKKTIGLKVYGKDNIENKILLSSMSKLFKENVKDKLNLENNNIVYKAKSEKKKIEENYKNIQMEKEKYINRKNLKKIKNESKVLPFKIKTYSEQIDDLAVQLQKDKTVIDNFDFKLNILPDYKFKQYFTIRNYLNKKQIKYNLEWQKNQFVDDLKTTNKQLNKINNEVEKYNQKIKKLDEQLEIKSNEVIRLEQKLSNAKYSIKTIENTTTENKKAKFYLIVVFISFLLALPFWKINLI